MRIAVHVTPKAGRDEVSGWRGTELAVRVSAAAEGGAANRAVCALLARAVGVPQRSVRVVRGQTSRHKQVEISGVTEEDVRAVLGEPPPDLLQDR